MSDEMHPTVEWTWEAIQEELERHAFELYAITHAQQLLDELEEAKKARARGEAVPLEGLSEAIARAKAAASDMSTKRGATSSI